MFPKKWRSGFCHLKNILYHFLRFLNPSNIEEQSHLKKFWLFCNCCCWLLRMMKSCNGTQKKKAQRPAGFKPSTTQARGECSSAVLQLQPCEVKRMKVAWYFSKFPHPLGKFLISCWLRFVSAVTKKNVGKSCREKNKHSFPSTDQNIFMVFRPNSRFHAAFSLTISHAKNSLAHSLSLTLSSLLTLSHILFLSHRQSFTT